MAKSSSRLARGGQDEMVVVGIGASAGGLEALQDFFKSAPLHTGVAYVVVQHLSPDYRSLMDELLARQTDIPILVVTDGMTVEPDHIYLLPPRKNISLFHGQLFLEDQASRKGLNLPVDIFFRSLAQDKGKNAVGIILSGTGSDGTLGTRAIKEAGGMVMVQDEKSAKFDGMPRSSISTGLVDYVLPADKMPEALVNYLKHPFVSKPAALETVLNQNLDGITKIVMLLRDYSGIDFSSYKENTILRRLERRVSINRFDNLDDYLRFLSESDKEKDILYRELLIGVTRFFRDPESFEVLKTRVLPVICAKKQVRVWTAGCSTGEEAYSLAILLQEYISQNNLNCEVKIFATDVDRGSVEFAGRGVYPESVMADVDPLYLAKYFSRVEDGFQINESIRRTIVFAAHNLLKDSPFSKLDLLVCRNLFIYLRPEMQARLLSMFYYSIGPEGFLFMGSSETIGELGDAYECLDAKAKIYRSRFGWKTPDLGMMPLPRLSVTEGEAGRGGRPRLLDGVRYDRVLESALAACLPPSVIIDGNHTILQVVNDVSHFLRPQPGKYSQNLFANMPNELGLFVNTLMRRLRSTGAPAAVETLVNVPGIAEGSVTLELRALPLEHSSLFLLSFLTGERTGGRAPAAEVGPPLDQGYIDRVGEIEKELQFTKESLQATVEELETSNEELQSSNEELIASNEELQSTNEELQSVNEELYTVNTEYQQKIEELTRLNNDMNNLLRNTEVGALYLDRNLCIRKITPIVSRIINVLASDVGRPLSHLALGGAVGLIEDVDRVVETLQPADREIAATDGTPWFVKIRPYRTDFNAVDGILLTFVDIARVKELSQNVTTANERLLEALRIGAMAWWEWDLPSGRVVYDERKATMVGYRPEEFPSTVEGICSLIHPDDYEASMQAMRDHLEGRSPDWTSLYRIRRKDGGYSWYYDRGKITLRDAAGAPVKLVGTVIDVTRVRVLEDELRANRQILAQVLDNSLAAQFMIDAVGWIRYANRKAQEIFGLTLQEIEARSYGDRDWGNTDLEGRPLGPGELPFALVRSSGKPVRKFRHYTKRADGSRMLLEVSGAPVKASDGSFQGAVFIAEVVDDEPVE